jgi:adenylate kinase family enzyme
MHSLNAILEAFYAEHLLFPPYVAAFKEIDRLILLYRETGIAQNLLVLGESGTGKTTLCCNIQKKYPRFSLPEQDVVPVLHVPIPSAATIASVTEMMLARLGDPAPTAGTVSAKTARAIYLAKALKVELFLFDEAQHIQDRGRLPTQYLVGDWLKAFIDELAIPTVLLGLPRTEQLLQVNEQLRRRFSCRRHMQMGQDENETIETECLQLFISLGTSLPLALHAGEFGWEELGRRVYYACDGRVAYVKKLLVGAIRVALDSNLNIIDSRVLEEAFTRDVWWEGIGPLNPFNPDFAFRRLTQPNEPFELGVPGARRTYRESTR